MSEILQDEMTYVQIKRLSSILFLKWFLINILQIHATWIRSEYSLFKTNISWIAMDITFLSCNNFTTDFIDDDSLVEERPCIFPSHQPEQTPWNIVGLLKLIESAPEWNGIMKHSHTAALIDWHSSFSDEFQQARTTLGFFCTNTHAQWLPLMLFSP